MKKIYVIGNWKMNKTIQEAHAFVDTFDQLVPTFQQKGIEVGVCPSFIALDKVKQNSKHLIVAAQNCHYENAGAFTGEVSIPMLREIGIAYCLIGHSERRLYQKESSVDCNKKLKQLFANQMTPIYCVGETLEQYELGQTKTIVQAQIHEGLKDLNQEQVAKIIIAYEPVWSIGTGKNASSVIAQDIGLYIRNLVKELYNQETADKVIILYGGSVKVNNVKEYISCSDVDGVLVGGASLEAQNFKLLIDSIL